MTMTNRLAPQPSTHIWGPVVIPPELNGRTLAQLLDLFVTWNLDFFKAWYSRTGKVFPTIYQWPIRYIPEPPGQEAWMAAPWVIIAGGSVCHSLAAWRVAELRSYGEDAQIVTTPQERADGSVLWHVRVLRGPGTRSITHPQGRMEDPSLFFGMGRSSEEARMLGPVHHAPFPGQY